ncbi:MAG: pyridoxamine 5'-phosphate oxidase family protein [Rhodobacteraceae bacterium]|nr:pyridoxamine 5'-phosphate oxidase family protein [Paracoccaceae bacterium]
MDAAPGSLRKVVDRITPKYWQWISASRFCVLTTVGPAGTDGSPRGDDGPPVIALDEYTLAMPDWRGNNRLDSLRNIVEDGRVSLLFLIGGENFAVRVNGIARLSADDKFRALFEKEGHIPNTVIVIKVVEIYSQCSRAFMRSDLWSQTRPADLPTAGDLLKEASHGDLGGTQYDSDQAKRSQNTLWSD